MEVRSIEGDLADPGSAAWGGAASETISLVPVPLDAQPTEYIRVAWADRPYGNVGAVSVAVAQSGGRAYVRLEWADSDAPNVEFHDGAGVYFPSGGDAPAATLGADGAEVSLWKWQANLPAAKALTSTGPGRFANAATDGVAASSNLDGGRWAVVLEGDAAALSAGKLGVVVWDGSNEERAGIGAATAEWIPLEIAS